MLRSWMAAFKGKPITDADLLTARERARDPYYQDFLKPHGVDNFGVDPEPHAGVRV